MSVVYRYVFARVLRWRREASVGPGGAIVLLSLIVVLNLGSALLALEAILGKPILGDLEFVGFYAAITYLASYALHHLLLVRNGRHLAIEHEFNERNPAHLVVPYYVYLVGSVSLFFVMVAYTSSRY